MSTELKKNDPAKAREYFEAKTRFSTGPGELNEQIENHADLVVVDVRDAEDFEKGHVPGAISLPREKWNAAEGLSKDKLNVLYCYSHVCHLAAVGAAQFAGKGYPVMEMDGGFEEWKANDLEVEKGAPARGRKNSRAVSV